MFWCTNCQGKCYIDPHLLSLDPSNPSKAQTSFNRIARSKRLDNAVRLCSSLNLMKKTSLLISKERKNPATPFNGQSDRALPSVNPITKKVGVDKKKGSYARYLALKKGNIIRSDNWKYAGQYGKKPYTPYDTHCEKNMQCCCTDVC